MQGVKISELPSATANGLMVVPVSADGVTGKVTISSIVGLGVSSVNGQNGAVTLTKSSVGLGNVDNTSDLNKPVSTAQQTALDLKAPIASPTFTGTVGGITKGMVGLGNVDNTSDANKPVSTAQQTALDLKAPLNSPTFTGTVGGITKGMVGLGKITVNNVVSLSGLDNAEVNFRAGGYVLYEESLIDGGVF